MMKLMKYLKGSIWAVALIIGLLAVQATADLALPDYTANIVNIGIQSSGIEEQIPLVIRESELNNLLLFVEETKKEEIFNNYKKLETTEDNINLYPLLRDEILYIYDSEVSIEKIMKVPILLNQAIKSDDGTLKTNISASLPNPEILDNMDLIEFFKTLSPEQLSNMLKENSTQIEEMPVMITNSMVTNYIKSEYEAIGVNISKDQNNYILGTGVTMISIALISMLATILVSFFGSKVSAKFAYKLRRDVFEKVIKFSNGEFSDFSTASLITRTTNDITQIQNLMVMMLRIIFYAPLLGIGGLMKILNTNASMAWIIGVAIAAMLVIIGMVVVFVLPKFKLVQKLVDKLNLVTREVLTGLLSVRAFSREKYEEKRFNETNNDLTKVNIFVNRVMAFLMPSMLLIMNGVILLIVWNSASSIEAGTMQIGDMLAFIQYAMQIIMAFLMISMVFILLPRATVSAKRIAEVLNKDVKIIDPEKPKRFNKNKKGYVEFKDVSFKYPGAENYVLRNINFIAKPGETTAFIGSTGSGKTSIVNLIPRFFEVTEGEVLVDGINIKDVKQKALRAKIGYIPQKGILFSGNIESNVKYGNTKLKEDKIKRAIKIAQASDFVFSSKEGIKRKITQAGTNVSGGQKQRLSIARAIAINPDIYIFDDSFSALDFKTDANLRKALKSEVKNSTVLIVAQRISTVMNADQIIVLEEGKIVNIGTHKELLKKCKVYKEIASSQLAKEEL